MIEPNSNTATTRRWFRYSLRSLFILMTLVAVGIVWAKQTKERLHRQKEVVASIWRQGGLVDYAHKYDARGICKPHAPPPGPQWLRELIGSEWGLRVVGVTSFGVPRLPYCSPSFVPRDDDLESISQLTGLKWLGLRQQRWITDAGLTQIAKLRRLESLEIRSCKGITDKGLAQLAHLPRLKHVALAGSSIDGSGLVHFRPRQLHTLNLGSTNITDEHLHLIARLEQLESLCLSRTQLTDRGLGQLAALARLRMLDLSNTSIGDEGLAQVLPPRAPLQHLYVGGTNITNKSVATIAGLDQLVSLDINNTTIDNVGIRQLVASCPSLRALNLSGTNITDDAIAEIAKLSALRELALNKPITSEALLDLSALTDLRSLLTGNIARSRQGRSPLKKVLAPCEIWGQTPVPVTEGMLWPHYSQLLGTRRFLLTPPR